MQMSVRFWTLMVTTYQNCISPYLRCYVRCRYSPSCSEFSRQAVQKYGIIDGLSISWERLRRCNGASKPISDDQLL